MSGLAQVCYKRAFVCMLTYISTTVDSNMHFRTGVPTGPRFGFPNVAPLHGPSFLNKCSMRRTIESHVGKLFDPVSVALGEMNKRGELAGFFGYHDRRFRKIADADFFSECHSNKLCTSPGFDDIFVNIQGNGISTEYATHASVKRTFDSWFRKRFPKPSRFERLRMTHANKDASTAPTSASRTNSHPTTVASSQIEQPKATRENAFAHAITTAASHANSVAVHTSHNIYNERFSIDHRNKDTPTFSSAPLVLTKPIRTIAHDARDLAISVPYDPKQTGAIQRGLLVWAQLQPCRSTTSATLVFTTTNNARAHDTIRRWVANTPRFARCFRQIEYETVYMPRYLDKYPAATWFVFDWTMRVSPLTATFRYVLQMEFDVSPVVPYWLDRLLGLTQNCSDNTWIIGDGVHRGGRMEMNGNALYHRTPAFIAFLGRFHKLSTNTKSRAYDSTMASFERGSIALHMLVSPAFVNCDMESTSQCGARSQTLSTTWNHISNETLLVHSRNRRSVENWKSLVKFKDLT